MVIAGSFGSGNRLFGLTFFPFLKSFVNHYLRSAFLNQIKTQ